MPKNKAATETPAAETPHTLAELAALISAVLNHPHTPRCVRDDLWNSVNELATPESFYNSASYVEGRLKGVEGPVVGPQKA
jgi:hypothetical protein